MAVHSLGFLCRQVVKDNIDELAYVGDLPYEAVKDLLMLVKTADQLAIIEENSPQIINMSDELYEKHVKTVFKVLHKRKEIAHRERHRIDTRAPLSPTWWVTELKVKTWRSLFHKYTVEQAAIEAESLRGLKANKAKLEQEKKAKQATVVQARDLPKIRTATKTAGSRRPAGKLSAVQKISSQTRQLAAQRSMVMPNVIQQQQRKIAPPKKAVIPPKPAASADSPEASSSNGVARTMESGGVPSKPVKMVVPRDSLFNSTVKLPSPKIVIKRFPAKASTPVRKPRQEPEVTPVSPTDSLFGPPSPTDPRSDPSALPPTLATTPSKKRPADDSNDDVLAAASTSGTPDSDARPSQKRRRKQPSLFIGKTDVRRYVKD